MKHLILIAAALSVTACSTHLPSTQTSELDGVRGLIQDARAAGAEKCAPAELAKAEALQLHAAHELDEGNLLVAEEDLIAEAEASAQQAIAKCSKPKAVVKPAVKIVPKPKPKPVVKPMVNSVIDLTGVFFESNSAKLTGSSFAVLDKAVKTLTTHANVNVEVAAHTDSDGKASYNQALSSSRANAVQDYLISKGIDASRLTAKGYGESQPIADNATRAGKAQNRRVELIVQ